VLTISKNISQENMEKLKNQFFENENQKLTFKESFEQKLDLLNDLDLIQDKITTQTLIGDSDLNIMNQIFFYGMGLGVGLGIDTKVPIVGFHIFSVYSLIGKVAINHMFKVSKELQGHLFGLIFGFCGILLKILIPYTYGPWIVGYGFTLLTFWAERSTQN
jgi:hypothetical protein